MMLLTRVSLLRLDFADVGVLILIFLIILFPPTKWKTFKLSKYWPFLFKKRVFERKVPGIRETHDIPGPKTFPFLGTRWIYWTRYSLSKVHEAYKDMFKRYGDVIKEEGLWNVKVISVRSRASVEKVLSCGGKYPLRPPTEVTAHYRASRPDRYTNLGIINEQGETWWTLRRELTGELTSGRLVGRMFPDFLGLAQDFARLVANRTASLSYKNTFHFNKFANRLGLESTCQLVLGRRMGFLDSETEEENKIGNLAWKLALAAGEQFKASRDTAYGFPLWKIFPTPSYRKFMESEDTLYDLISEIVEETVAEEKETCQVEEAGRVFAEILKAPSFDVKDKKAAIIDFIAAGIKTLGNSLIFTLYLLAKNPECQKKLYDEMISLNEEYNGVMTLNTLKAASYLKAAINEAFRVLPTAPWLARILDTDMEFEGYHLGPGSIVLCHSWSACLDETNFPEADRFKPERWLEPDGQSQPFHLVAPFGAGRRICPGKRFVETQLQLVIAELVRQFEIEFDGEIELEFEFLLAPKHPVSSFRFRPRI